MLSAMYAQAQAQKSPNLQGPPGYLRRVEIDNIVWEFNFKAMTQKDLVVGKVRELIPPPKTSTVLVHFRHGVACAERFKNAVHEKGFVCVMRDALYAWRQLEQSSGSSHEELLLTACSAMSACPPADLTRVAEAMLSARQLQDYLPLVSNLAPQLCRLDDRILLGRGSLLSSGYSTVSTIRDQSDFDRSRDSTAAPWQSFVDLGCIEPMLAPSFFAPSTTRAPPLIDATNTVHVAGATFQAVAGYAAAGKAVLAARRIGCQAAKDDSERRKRRGQPSQQQAAMRLRDQHQHQHHQHHHRAPSPAASAAASRRAADASGMSFADVEAFTAKATESRPATPPLHMRQTASTEAKRTASPGPSRGTPQAKRTASPGRPRVCGFTPIAKRPGAPEPPFRILEEPNHPGSKGAARGFQLPRASASLSAGQWSALQAAAPPPAAADADAADWSELGLQLEAVLRKACTTKAGAAAAAPRQEPGTPLHNRSASARNGPYASQRTTTPKRGRGQKVVTHGALSSVLSSPASGKPGAGGQKGASPAGTSALSSVLASPAASGGPGAGGQKGPPPARTAHGALPARASSPAFGRPGNGKAVVPAARGAAPSVASSAASGRPRGTDALSSILSSPTSGRPGAGGTAMPAGRRGRLLAGPEGRGGAPAGRRVSVSWEGDDGVVDNRRISPPRPSARTGASSQPRLLAPPSDSGAEAGVPASERRQLFRTLSLDHGSLADAAPIPQPAPARGEEENVHPPLLSGAGNPRQDVSRGSVSSAPPRGGGLRESVEQWLQAFGNDFVTLHLALKTLLVLIDEGSSKELLRYKDIVTSCGMLDDRTVPAQVTLAYGITEHTPVPDNPQTEQDQVVAMLSQMAQTKTCLRHIFALMDAEEYGQLAEYLAKVKASLFLNNEEML
ncbi:hypothetical protein DIPPA_02363 [Diplonema papillatum]|nr:hypothetical protein DIPPA_02363 [Diplonema papillatum]